MLIRLVVGALLLAGCSSSDPEPAPAPGPSSTSTSTSTSTSAPPSKPPPSKRPTYRSSIRRLTADEKTEMTGGSWRPGCPLPLERLRVLTVRHWDFTGRTREGVLIVRDDVAREAGAIFRRLFRDRFPIRRIVPVDQYDADDYTSIEADNTSAFNCRPITGSTDEWSHHAYGVAIDLNPLENPYVLDGRTIHDGSVRYLDRTRYRRGMILEGGPVVRAFEAAGWFWGGDWENPVDYQHFSALPAGAVIR